MHAYARAGIELGIVADARFGDVLFMAPALNTSLAPPCLLGGTHHSGRSPRKRRPAEKIAKGNQRPGLSGALPFR
jgi:hypothetical protein